LEKVQATVRFVNRFGERSYVRVTCGNKDCNHFIATIDGSSTFEMKCRYCNKINSVNIIMPEENHRLNRLPKSAGVNYF